MRALPALLLCIVVAGCEKPPKPTPALIPELIVEEAHGIIEREFLDPNLGGKDWRRAWPRKSPRTLEQSYAAIRAMLETLDEPATRLLEPEQRSALMEELTGAETVGVGLPELLSLDVDARTRELVVVTPQRDTPASRAGIRSGDVLESINGTPVRGVRLEQAEQWLRDGEAGSEVELTFRRGKQRISVTLTRERIPLSTRPVPSRVESRGGHPVGYFRVETFGPGTADAVRSTVAKLRQEGAERLVLDLRGNPGGLLTEAVNVAGQFLGPKPVATFASRPERTRELKAERPQEVDLPLVVLVDEGTASAAEMLAGALQANGRARLVGARTFGKGLVHDFFPLADRSALIVTVGRIVTPKGRDILAEGIEPDVSVPGVPSGDALPGPGDARYAKALEVLEAQPREAQQQRPPPPR